MSNGSYWCSKNRLNQFLERLDRYAIYFLVIVIEDVVRSSLLGGSDGWHVPS